jgi:hypothetical protein
MNIEPFAVGSLGTSLVIEKYVDSSPIDVCSAMVEFVCKSYVWFSSHHSQAWLSRFKLVSPPSCYVKDSLSHHPGCIRACETRFHSQLHAPDPTRHNRT